MTLLQGAQEFGAVLDTLQVVLEYVGTVAFAISGALVASRKGMDIGGMVSLGAIVSVGGGTTRDLLLGRSVFWVEDPTFLALGAITALLVIPVAHLAGTRVARAYPLIQTFDAIGLALFVVTSTSIALSAGASEVSAATIGVVAGIGGGVIRDVLANEVPQVLVDRRLYITAALAGSIAYLVLLRWEAPGVVAVWVPIAIVLLLRLASLRFGYSLPAVLVDLEKSRRTDG